MNWKDKKILVIVAHPDDELLGSGGSMNKLINEERAIIRAVILGEGITSRTNERNKDLWEKELKEHKSNIQDAANIIGFESVGIYNFPDNRFDAVDLLDVVKVIEKEKTDFNPEIIFTHHGFDLNIDHQQTFAAVLTAIRPMDHEKVRTVITFETPSSTEWQSNLPHQTFQPNLYIGLNEKNVKTKCSAMESYKFESRPYPHPRSPKALTILAQKRGIEVGLQYAEAFQIIRMISN